MSITQGYRGSVDLGTGQSLFRMPALPGSTFSLPKNYQFPPVAHNMAYQYTHCEGLQVPILNLSLVVMETWFTATNLNAWLITRTADDLSVITGGASFWDGASGYSVKDVKANTLVLGSSQGQPISATMMLMAAEPDAVLADPTFLVITEQPLNWSLVDFEGAENVAAWQLMITNSCAPNPVHAQSVHPSEINAQRLLASLRLTLLAEQERPPDGDPITIKITKPTAQTIVSFKAINPLCLIPEERSIAPERAFRQYDYALLGDEDAGVEVEPIEISEDAIPA